MQTIQNRQIILASASTVRLGLMQAAGLDVAARPARIDEEGMRAALHHEGASPRDQADALAEMKARKIADRNPECLVLGCDQILACKGTVFGKPSSREQAMDHLSQLCGNTHQLLSAMVLYDQGKPIWRHVGTARLTMTNPSPAWLLAYVDRNWDSIRHSVGCYKLEEEGIRLFTAIEGDYFTILGLPMLPLLSYLGLRGFIET
jgi:septum formation protein